jgi:predicted membrane-bound spermidine synthase
MAWSLLILFSYQSRSGALYGRLGLLAALFMLGLAAGGFAMRRATELAAVRARRRLLAVTLCGLFFAAILPRALPWTATAGLPSELIHGLLLLAAGLVTGATFPTAAGVLQSVGGEVGTTASRLERADHVGAAVAALVCGVVYIPVLGLVGTAWLLVAIEVAALAGLALVRVDRSGVQPA